MNRYLSYEKSKRLAELGYKPEIEGWNWYELVGEDKSIEIVCSCEGFIYQYGQTYTAICPAPDCHDLLMELQKHNSGLKRFTLTGRLLEDAWKVTCMVTCIDYKFAEIDQCCDPNPVEALGEALIKILEAEQ
jgi:hypothetical protein